MAHTLTYNTTFHVPTAQPKPGKWDKVVKALDSRVLSALFITAVQVLLPRTTGSAAHSNTPPRNANDSTAAVMVAAFQELKGSNETLAEAFRASQSHPSPEQTATSGLQSRMTQIESAMQAERNEHKAQHKADSTKLAEAASLNESQRLSFIAKLDSVIAANTRATNKTNFELGRQAFELGQLYEAEAKRFSLRNNRYDNAVLFNKAGKSFQRAYELQYNTEESLKKAHENLQKADRLDKDVVPGEVLPEE